MPKRSRLSKKTGKVRKSRMAHEDAVLARHERVMAYMVAGQKNPWISGQVMREEGDPFGAVEFQLTKKSFSFVDSISQLKSRFKHGNWSLNTAFVYKDFAFINQVNGGDEWAVFKYDPKTGTAFSFESISAIPMIKEKNFDDFMKRIQSASDGELKKVSY